MWSDNKDLTRSEGKFKNLIGMLSSIKSHQESCMSTLIADLCEISNNCSAYIAVLNTGLENASARIEQLTRDSKAKFQTLKADLIKLNRYVDDMMKIRESSLRVLNDLGAILSRSEYSKLESRFRNDLDFSKLYSDIERTRTLCDNILKSQQEIAAILDKKKNAIPEFTERDGKVATISVPKITQLEKELNQWYDCIDMAQVIGSLILAIAIILNRHRR